MPNALHNTRAETASQRGAPHQGPESAGPRAGRAIGRAAALALASVLLAVAAFVSQPGSVASARPLLQATSATIVGLPTEEATSASVTIESVGDHVLSVAVATPTGLDTLHLLSPGDAVQVTIGWGTPTPVPEPTFAAGQVALRLHYNDVLPALAPDESRLGVYYSATGDNPWTRIAFAAGACTHDTTANTFLFDLTAAGYYVVAAPEIASITVSPNPARPHRGDNVQFTAHLLDYEGQAVAGVAVTWQAAPTAGTIDSASGLFTATGSVGTYANAVTARYLAISGSATIEMQYWRSFEALAMRRWSARVVPNDPYYASLQPNMAQVQAPMAWSVTRGGGGPVVAIVDSGIDLDHPDLAANLVAGWDFVGPGDGVPNDENGHGTHVAGIVGAIGNNAIGVAGMGWAARLMPVRVLDASGVGNVTDAVEGIRWAADHGAAVINLSLGTATAPIASDGSDPLANAVAYAISKGCVVVAASGNTSPAMPAGTAVYPAAYPGVVSVGAVNGSNSLASFSNTGPFLDVVAPGVNITSTYAGGGYLSKGGTSMASPHVAGLAALIFAARPSLTADQVRSAITGGARDLGPAGWDEAYGYGVIDAYRAIAMAGQSSSALAEPEAAATGASRPVTLEAGTYNPGILWVQVHDGLSAEAVLGGDSALSGMAAAGYVPNLVRANVEPGTEAEAMQRLAATPGVDSVYPDYILFAQ